MARKSPQRPNAEKPEASAEEVGAGTDAAEEGTADVSADASDAQPADRSLWTETNVDPIEVALPAGVGYTLRAYRLSTVLTPTDISDREDDDEPFAGRSAIDEDDEEVVLLDEEFAELTAEDAADDETAKKNDETAEKGTDDASDTAAKAEEDEESEVGQGEEVPFFLTHRGRLLLFKSPESLVAFIRSGAPHDLAELDTWAELAERVQPADVAAADEDSYELDLVVENLRGGNDTWDLRLLIRAGEVARDLGYALRLRRVMAMLSPGSPLDDLDEAMRAASGGGVGAFIGRRRLRKMGAQQASIGWRSIIGKISAAVDWRD